MAQGNWVKVEWPPEPEPTSIPYNIAIVLAKFIQERNPNFELCGSLALMLYGLLPKGEVHDLDFASAKCVTKPKDCKQTKQTSRSIRNQRSNYICYGFKYEVDCLSIHYDVFYYPELESGATVDGLKLQSADQIIFFKRQFNRPKDKEMLSKIDTALDNMLLGIE